MSRGKPRHGAPPDAAAAEREEMRQLTRELHEAAQAATAAARQVAAERRAIVDDLGTRFQPVIDAYQRELQGHIDKQMSKMVVDTQTLQREIQEKVATWLGASSPEDLMDLILRQTGDRVLEELGAAMASRDISLTREGQVEVTARQARRGQVLVGTREQLDAYIAEGGDPGIVFDMWKG